MKKFLTLLLMLALIGMPAGALDIPNSLQRRATHQIIFPVMVPSDEPGQLPTLRHGLCTSSALGPHALLTATHCDVGETTLRVDREIGDRHVLGRIADGKDHTILFVDGDSFKDVMNKFYNPDSYSMDKVGDDVFLYGDGAGMYPPQYRKGYRMDSVQIGSDEVEGMPTGTVYLFDINIIGGDSGSAIYDKHGNLVSLVTYGINGGKYCGAYIMAFTAEQVKRAKNFNGIPTHDVPPPCPEGRVCIN
jgi:hypothetical protein